jgi:hypothetical protein
MKINLIYIGGVGAFYETPQIFRNLHPELYTHVSRMINFQERY